MDPLLIAGGIRERIDLLLGDGMPLSDSDFLTGNGTEFVDGSEGPDTHGPNDRRQILGKCRIVSGCRKCPKLKQE